MITWFIEKLGLLPLILWIRKSFEENGEPSSRRFGAFHCMALITYMVYRLTSSDQIKVTESIWYGLLVLAGLMYGLITAGNILSFLNKDKPKE